MAMHVKYVSTMNSTFWRILQFSQKKTGKIEQHFFLSFFLFSLSISFFSPSKWSLQCHRIYMSLQTFEKVEKI